MLQPNESNTILNEIYIYLHLQALITAFKRLQTSLAVDALYTCPDIDSNKRKIYVDGRNLNSLYRCILIRKRPWRCGGRRGLRGGQNKRWADLLKDVAAGRRAEWSHTLLPYNVTMQMYVGRLCVYALTHTGRRESPPHNPRLSPAGLAPAGSRQRWFYACECTHAALSLEARHWLLKRVAGGGRRVAGRSERVTTGRRPSVSDGRADLRALPIGTEAAPRTARGAALPQHAHSTALRRRRRATGPLFPASYTRFTRYPLPDLATITFAGV